MGKGNGNGKKKVEEIVEKLSKLGENESYELSVVDMLEKPYTAEIGYYGKEGRCSYQIKIRYGINQLLKIRNFTDFEQIKTVIEFLDKNKHYLEALDKLNGNKKTSRASRRERI